MADYSSGIKVLPQDYISPAIENAGKQMMQAEAMLRADEERRMERLNAMATFTMGDMVARDKAEVEKQKDEFLKKLVPEYRKHNGILPYETQADFNANKQSINLLIAKAEADRKEYYDVAKVMATNKDVDKTKTAEALKTWLSTPIGDRGSAYDAINMTFDLSEYFKKNVTVSPKEWSSKMDEHNKAHPERIYNYTQYSKQQVLDQMMNMYRNNPSVKKEIQDQMAKVGRTGTTDEDAAGFLVDYKYVDPFTRDDMKFTERGRTTTNVYNFEPTEVEPGGTPNQRTITTSIAGGQAGKLVDMTMTTGSYTTLPGKSVLFKANGIHQLNNNQGPEDFSGGKQMTLQMIEALPVVYVRGEWYLATDEWRAANPGRENEVVMKNYIMGRVNEKVTTGTGSSATTQVVENDFAVPATEQNLKAVKTALGPKTKFNEKEYISDFTAPQGAQQVYTFEQVRSAHPDYKKYSDKELAEMYAKNNIRLVVKK